MGRHRSASFPCTPLNMRCMERMASPIRSSCLPLRRSSPASLSLAASSSSSLLCSLSCVSLDIIAACMRPRSAVRRTCSAVCVSTPVDRNWCLAWHSATSFSPASPSLRRASSCADSLSSSSCLPFRSRPSVSSSARWAAMRALTSSLRREYSCRPAASSFRPDCSSAALSSCSLRSPSASSRAAMSPSRPDTFCACWSRSFPTRPMERPRSA
mmetsp:Transcript_14613/g.32816  ORF Transcript_14613/g.32816 Transcript_14613/m.32816 type:complete len:213 (+) Transcript_14613:387-1025(+)